MGERGLIGKNIRKKAPENPFYRNGPRNASSAQRRKSNDYGAVKFTNKETKETKAQSTKRNHAKSERYGQILSDNEPGDYNEHDDHDIIEEENETNYVTNDGRSTG
ncbi:7609_t:CDS:2 [Funneliformis mosseae]|uniref:7609_t:CDS:1 n=1 Tax=Funneliformis mosseae TaxID=27381 RepID=A0A9N9B4Y3_FUNMO|nr:7609_t:CDS:2 [Funneliformis mosseae]